MLSVSVLASPAAFWVVPAAGVVRELVAAAVGASSPMLPIAATAQSPATDPATTLFRRLILASNFRLRP